MTKIYDQQYLKDIQYKRPDKLQARIELHKRFSTNPYDWQHWVLDTLNLEDGTSVLEIGCGPADLWLLNLDRLPRDIKVVLGDLSLGMVGDARRSLGEQGAFTFFNIDVQAVPVPANMFDWVVANHMFYHVPDINLGMSEVARILKPSGWLCTATNGLRHMMELRELINQFIPDFQSYRKEYKRFVLENASATLKPFFTHVEVREYESNLMVTEVEPLMNYILSIGDINRRANQDRICALERHIRELITSQGAFAITKSVGVFLAQAKEV